MSLPKNKGISINLIEQLHISEKAVLDAVVNAKPTGFKITVEETNGFGIKTIVNECPEKK